MRYISGLGSPTDKPPIARPGKSSCSSPRRDCSRRSSYIAPCTMPNRALGFLRSSKAFLLRSAQRRLICSDFSACSRVASPGVHSSSCMAMSELSTVWIFMEISGERKSLSPLIGLLKVQPSSVSLRMSDSENTWKPPESVKIGLFQPIKSCRPLNCSMTSKPGRSHKW